MSAASSFSDWQAGQIIVQGPVSTGCRDQWPTQTLVPARRLRQGPRGYNRRHHGDPRVRRVLTLVFFLSGAAALLFQTLWFRQAGLVFGNGVWASSLVLSSFMAGLALGNALAPRLVASRPPLRVYVALEVAIGLAGLALVAALPDVGLRLAPLFRGLADRAAALNAARFAVSFALLLLPTTAMGATLPTLVGAVSRSREDFGGTLGWLYGWNTAGAVAGSLLGEFLLLERLGVPGTGLCAAAANLAAAALALGLWRRSRPAAAEPDPPAPSRLPPAGLLVAAALCGGIVLGLEVAWFRFLQLFVVSDSFAFAVMLAVVLGGIALGGLLAGRWLTRQASAPAFLPALALVGAALTVASWASFEAALRPGSPGRAGDLPTIGLRAAWLMLPTCLLSGVLFPLLGQRLREGAGAVAATGWLTLANTAGAALGALAAGLLLLPALGVEGTIWLLALLYLGVAVATLPAIGASLAGRRALVASTVVLLGLVAALPRDLMRGRHVPRIASRYPGEPVVLAAHEGRTEMSLYLARRVLGHPVVVRLMTDGFSMSARNFYCERYMRAYAFLPLAAHPKPRQALLISFGLGSTAEALTDSAELTRIDVVDISRDILRLGRLVFPPGRYPLDDPRVHVHVEDGRQYLQTTGESYDVVTAEPPPPLNAGVVNLYSREYFGLVRARLRPGGFCTHWLPVYLLRQEATRSVVRGFCDVFPDCTLWTGAGLNWMLVGSREAGGPVTEEEFSRPWRQERLATSLRRAALETPAHLAATFLADGPFLGRMTAGTQPLVDAWPLRLGRRSAAAADLQGYYAMMEPDAVRERIATSAALRRLVPAGVLAAIGPALDQQRILDDYFLSAYGHLPALDHPPLFEALTRTGSRSLPWVAAGHEPREADALAGALPPGLASDEGTHLAALQSLAERDYASAAAGFARVPHRRGTAELRILSLCLAGEGEAAAPLFGSLTRPQPDPEREFWAWLRSHCAPPPPDSPPWAWKRAG